MRAHRRLGFSLVEISVVAAILGFLLIASFQMITMANAVYTQQSIKQFTRLQAQKILDQMADDIRYSAGWTYQQVKADGTSPTRLTRFYGGTTLLTRSDTNQALF